MNWMEILMVVSYSYLIQVSILAQVFDSKSLYSFYYLINLD